MSCDCRTGATCADHLAEADLTLRPVPFGLQTYPNRASLEERIRLLEAELRQAQRMEQELAAVAASHDHGHDTPTCFAYLIRRTREYRTKNDKPRAQWCVHRVEGDGSLSQIMVCDSRREALMWAAENV